MTSPELKDCPFCGGKAEWVETYTRVSYAGRDDGYGMRFIRCTSCGISTNEAIEGNEKQVREITYFWNRRISTL